MSTEPRRSQGTEADAFMSGKPFAEYWKAMYFDMPLTLASDLARYVSQRMQAQSDLCLQLQHAENLSDVVKAEMNFMQEATRDFTSQSSKLMKAANITELRKAG